MTLTVQSAFVCDDVRQEINGKLIFIGVYNEELQVPSFPASIRLTVVMTQVNDEAKVYDFEIEGLLDDQLALGIEGQLDATQVGRSFAPLQLPPLKFDKEGTFKVRFREKKKRWQDVTRLRILRQSVSVPTASAQPS